MSERSGRSKASKSKGRRSARAGTSSPTKSKSGSRVAKRSKSTTPTRAKKKTRAARSRAAAKPAAAVDASGGATDVAVDDRAARAALRDSDKLYYRIGEVSRLTGVKAHVLRYWETEFRWMAPPKSRSKQRLYRKRDIEFVWLLKRLLWSERYTIAGARQRIQDLGVEKALALLDEDAVTAATSARASGSGTREMDAAESPAAPPATSNRSAGSAADWASFRASLDQIQGELVALRDVLHDGA